MLKQLKSMFLGKENTAKVNEIIAAIHNEFDTAEDVLLQQADAVLEELKIETQTGIEERAELSEKIGFVNVPSVKRAKELQSKIAITKAQAERIRFYKQNYPFQKFLTEEELDRICTKYQLVYAPIVNYVEEVPTKNLKEIQSAKPLDSNHIGDDLYILKCDGYFSSKTTKKIKDELKQGILVGQSYHWTMRNNEYCKNHFNIDYNVSEYDALSWSITNVSRNGLFIAAPKSHFDLKGLSQTNKFSFNFVTEVKDPIVFRYCKGGIQVLSKWGLEASDESLINSIEN